MSSPPKRWFWAPERSDYRKLWIAQSISFIGTQVTFIAFPLAAILALHADTWQVGVLNALETAPMLLFGLVAGVLVDRWRQRRLLITADWVRAVVMGSVPVAWAFDVLTVEWLWVVAFVVGVGTVFFDIASQTVLTSIVDRDSLMPANQRLEASHSVAQTVGPGVAAGLLKVVSAPVAVAVDAVSFAVSALFLHGIRSKDPEPEPSAEPTTLRSDLRAGFRFLAGSPFLRWIVSIAASWNLMLQTLVTIIFIYMARDLNLGSSKIAIVMFAGSATGLVAVLLVERINKVLGLGLGLAFATGLSAVGGILMATASGASYAAVATVAFGSILVSVAVPLFNVNVSTIRQAITPRELMGRTTAAVRFVVWSTMPLGALLGGFLGEVFGNRVTVATAGVALLVPALLTLLSPIRRIRDLSDAAPVGAAPGDEEIPEEAVRQG
ncbi:MFS transporter [Actinoplanes oblitus]|uniref:MFS transporter n=1 Tax=Actinoplanes oblitus TaxID=3040509 RepID=A0ABY8W982_9ACTN|nr:MFS transporter [Actinoplanes oblitus]WIM94401.1 MFS transporter [Actinoplanes oblitus]